MAFRLCDCNRFLLGTATCPFLAACKAAGTPLQPPPLQRGDSVFFGPVGLCGRLPGPVTGPCLVSSKPRLTGPSWPGSLRPGEDRSCCAAALFRDLFAVAVWTRPCRTHVVIRLGSSFYVRLSSLHTVWALVLPGFAGGSRRSGFLRSPALTLA